MTKKIIAFLVLALTLTASVFAAGLFDNGEKEVTVIMKYNYDCPLDYDFLQKTFNLKADFKDPTCGDFVSFKVTYNKKTEVIEIPAFKYVLSDDPYVALSSGVISGFKNNFDPKKEILYLGSWNVKFDPFTFAVTNVVVKDEYDQAVEWYGKNVNAKDTDKIIRCDFADLK